MTKERSWFKTKEDNVLVTWCYSDTVSYYRDTYVLFWYAVYLNAMLHLFSNVTLKEQ